MAATTGEFSQWINEAFKEEKFKKIDIEISGSSEKGDGYVGVIAFVEATALTTNEETKQFNLVVKYGKQSEELRELMPVRLIFEREIFMYSTAAPAFKRFEEKRNFKVLDTFMPKCFGSILYEKQEVLILQNLKAIGYDLHDRFQPLDINHLRLTFENYGKWHGLSIAYRDQAPKEFNELFNNLEDVMERAMSSLPDIVRKAEATLFATLEKYKEFGLSDGLRRRFPDDFFDTMQKLFKAEELNSVLVHGDCWNNNMMFQYDDTNQAQPQAVKYLDFQMSNLRSPVYDLAYHLYSTASEKELQQFKELLRVYHSSLSKTIKSFGSDPEKLFPYTELVRQWKKYSSYGVIMAALALPIVLTSKEDTLDLEDMAKNKMDDLLQKVMEGSYNGLALRLIVLVRHFLEFNDF